MSKRIFDLILAGFGLLVSVPFVLFGMLGILMSSPGPVFYRAIRVGRHGRLYNMLKLRTMHVQKQHSGVITAPGDSRVFAWGWFLRNSKIDELPQLLNIIVGHMSFVGPRPEDPTIVKDHYQEWMMESLNIRPGITSPGTLFGYIRGDDYLDQMDVEGSYIRELLPRKLRLDIEYFRKPNVISDVVVIVRTLVVIGLMMLRRLFTKLACLLNYQDN